MNEMSATFDYTARFRRHGFASRGSTELLWRAGVQDGDYSGLRGNEEWAQTVLDKALAEFRAIKPPRRARRARWFRIQATQMAHALEVIRLRLAHTLAREDLLESPNATASVFNAVRFLEAMLRKWLATFVTMVWAALAAVLLQDDLRLRPDARVDDDHGPPGHLVTTQPQAAHAPPLGRPDVPMSTPAAVALAA
jgi:hypothetical protein